MRQDWRVHHRSQHVDHLRHSFRREFVADVQEHVSDHAHQLLDHLARPVDRRRCRIAFVVRLHVRQELCHAVHTEDELHPAGFGGKGVVRDLDPMSVGTRVGSTRAGFTRAFRDNVREDGIRELVG